ncbi:MAG: LytTR family transcriptional regulator DNA-binding domain-containing protein [Bacteroidales bacterium]|jgi:two-component system LytT family response regulator|nr:LytTR family transcriptional regulator DNA-binding domain-containing protein [Bacteroidales bacterium]NLM93647.1 response regulator [Bacteroidales bacterium]
MKSYKALIIEDEQPARDLLKEFLKEFEQIELAGEYGDGFEGLKAINRLKPELIFLDIQMPRIDGFEMLELVDEENLPLVIFTTAYDQYALKAFEYNALDYLLKPVMAGRFRVAVQKALQSLDAGNGKREELSKALNNRMEEGAFLDRIVLRSGEGIQVIAEEDIYCLEAQDDYVLIATCGEEFLKKKTLKYFEDHLDPAFFVRVHRSYIVRLDAIQKIEPYSKDAYLAILKNGRKVAVSKSGYGSLRERLSF